MTYLKRGLPLLLFLVLAFFLWQGLGKNPHEIPSVLIGKQVPAFDYPSLSDPQQKITNTVFNGQVTLLNVWATWCVTCQAEQGELLKISRMNVVNMVGINYKDQRQRAIQYLQAQGNPFKHIIYDPEGNLAINFGVYGTPETFLIDKKGVIRDKIIGAISPRIWQDKLLPEIKKLAS